ncbi:MAG: hypothetical protein Q8N51_10255 [Gammaproteobacteria bacterium]|nr:hypothetical protein [Gammaproteobacteria bacterium]
MKPVDHITPTVPSNWVRRVEERRRKRDPEKGPQQNRDQKQPPGPGPDGRTHIIDELA